MNLPIEFEARMRALLGNEYEAFAAALTEEAVKGLRINSAKVSAEAFCSASPFALRRIPYTEEGYIVADDEGAGKHPYHHAGAYYMQDPGAMATVAALPRELLARRGLRILDLCAAPGGKTTQLAAACAANGGVVLANEYNASRARILAGNVERLGLSNVCVTNADSKYIAQWYPDFFDVAVIDAPCSGEGMFRKNDRAIEEWSEENVHMCAQRQREILENGAAAVAPDGYLLYSTCTYAVEENEALIAAFLASHPDFSLCPCATSVVAHTADGIVSAGSDTALSLCRRFYPHRAHGEGQFMALLHREAGASASDRREWRLPAPNRAEVAVAEDFMKETLGYTLEGLCACGGMLCVLPNASVAHFSLPPFGVVAAGCALGEVRKGRLVPHHHFFSAYGAALRSRVILSPESEETKKYLLGEEIGVQDAKGYTAVLLRVGEEVVSLGGGKAVDGRLKNYYPKGLRVRL